jgi:hypothetical protein
MSQRFTTNIACPFCAWRAKHTADEAGEVLQFLAATLQRHLAASHSEDLNAIGKIEVALLTANGIVHG